jgi:putative CocE/NonD family hydrolase
VFSELAGQLRTFLAEQEVDRWAFHEIHANVEVPVCHLTGWWDYVVQGTVANFLGLRSLGKPELREEHRLIIGPWSHSIGELDKHIGVVNYGGDALSSYSAEITRWYDHALKGIANGVAEEPSVRLFVLNRNRWYFTDGWPPEATTVELFLHSNGHANTPRGDGRLSVAHPDGQPTDSFAYDPHDPLMSSADWSSRAVDQSIYDHRRDVLVYTTEPLEDDLLVVGDVRCILWVASDAPETDFTAKIVEVRPDGLAIAVSTGIFRTRYLNGYDGDVRLEPGRPYELTISLSPVGIEFERGSRIRLDISSSDFPNFDRNHNTGDAFWRDAALRVARQTVLHDRDHPSRVELPTQPALFDRLRRAISS